MKVNVNPEFPIGGQYFGNVNIIDRIVDSASGTFGVFLEVPNPKLDVPAGVKCRADFPITIEGQNATQASKKISPTPSIVKSKTAQ